jgi:hypothetical protein
MANSPLQQRYIANYMGNTPSYGTMFGATHLNPATVPSVYGYPMREPFQSEREFFSKNKNVGGMAAEDNAVVLNPYSTLSPSELSAVARNEAARLYMREQKSKFDFDLTPQQKKAFEGTAYGDPANANDAKASILARGLSGDPSAGDVTPQQRAYADRIGSQLKARDVRPLTPGEYVDNPSGGWSSEISLTVPHPTKPGKFTNIPSVWLVGGVPKRLTQDEAIAAARQSGLDWPEFDNPQVADNAAADRETNWGNLGRQDAAQAPPLWSRR